MPPIIICAQATTASNKTRQPSPQLHPVNGCKEDGCGLGIGCHLHALGDISKNPAITDHVAGALSGAATVYGRDVNLLIELYNDSLDILYEEHKDRLHLSQTQHLPLLEPNVEVDAVFLLNFPPLAAVENGNGDILSDPSNATYKAVHGLFDRARTVCMNRYVWQQTNRGSLADPDKEVEKITSKVIQIACVCPCACFWHGGSTGRGGGCVALSVLCRPI